MIGDTGAAGEKSPNELGGANTQMLAVYVDDVDEDCDRACPAYAAAGELYRSRDQR